MKVTVELGATIPTTQYGNIRPTIRIEEIDTDGDVSAQIQRSIDVAAQAFAKIDDRIIELVDDAASAAGNHEKITDRVKRIEQELESISKRIPKDE